MTLDEDFLINLAASLAYDLLGAGAARLKALTLGNPAQAALRASYEAGFRAMLDAVMSGLDRDQQALVTDIFHDFVREPAVADRLLDMTLTGAPLPDLTALREQFVAQFAPETLPVDFTQALVVFHQGLTDALVAEASRQDSPLFNQVNLGRVIALQTLLHGQQRSLTEINTFLARLEAQGGSSIYNIVIAQATGVAIGDGATVQRSLPPDVQRTLAEMLALVPELRDSQLQREPDSKLTEAEYRAKMAAAFRALYFPLSGLDEPIDLDEVYLDLPLVKVSSEEAMIYQEGRGWPAKDGFPVRANNLLSRTERAALVGIIGTGKTTNLRYLTWLYAQRPEHRFCWRKAELTPFYARVHDLAVLWPAEQRETPEAFMEALARACARAVGGAVTAAGVKQILRDSLNKRQAVILLDALDEYRAPQDRRQLFVSSLQHLWNSQYMGNFMMISSRPYGFLNPMGYPQYGLREIEDAEPMVFRLGGAVLRRSRPELTDELRNEWLQTLNAVIRRSKFNNADNVAISDADGDVGNEGRHC